MSNPERPVLLYDGHCGFCHGTVRAILRLERRPDLLFAPQQSAAGREILQSHKVSSAPETVVLVSGGRVFFKSDAVLESLRSMGGFWPAVAAVGQLFPRLFRDAVYDYISRHRDRIMGTRSDACSLPAPDQRGRFLQ